MSSSSSFPNAYQLPNDFPESQVSFAVVMCAVLQADMRDPCLQRLDLQHRIWTKLIGGLYPTDLRGVIEERLGSTSDPEILDVGCGTGIWFLHFHAA